LEVLQYLCIRIPSCNYAYWHVGPRNTGPLEPRIPISQMEKMLSKFVPGTALNFPGYRRRYSGTRVSIFGGQSHNLLNTTCAYAITVLSIDNSSINTHEVGPSYCSLPCDSLHKPEGAKNPWKAWTCPTDRMHHMGIYCMQHVGTRTPGWTDSPLGRLRICVRWNCDCDTLGTKCTVTLTVTLTWTTLWYPSMHIDKLQLTLTDPGPV
jgi:hypothetical protein